MWGIKHTQCVLAVSGIHSRISKKKTGIIKHSDPVIVFSLRIRTAVRFPAVVFSHSLCVVYISLAGQEQQIQAQVESICVSPRSAEQGVDILQMLTKARDNYDKVTFNFEFC